MYIIIFGFKERIFGISRLFVLWKVFRINLTAFTFRCLANLLAGLVAYQEEVGTRVVDGVMEDIRLGMEVNMPKFNQRRVAQIKYLAELYNYRIVESADIFKVCIYCTLLTIHFVNKKALLGALLVNHVWSHNGPLYSVSFGSAKQFIQDPIGLRAIGHMW